MASITAFRNVHLEERRGNRLPWSLVPRATVVDTDRVCWPGCTPSRCPITFTFLSYDDHRVIDEEVRTLLHRIPMMFPLPIHQEE
jgi:hypothetical protein